MLAEPTVIDLEKIEKAARGAGYELQRVDLTISGRIVSSQGAEHLIASGTGQRFVIHGETEGGDAVTVRGKLTQPTAEALHELTLD